MHITTERRCIACREHFLKNEMLRISKKDGNIIVNDHKKINGRGVYICRKKSCIELAIKKKLLNKVFSQNVDDKIYEELRGYIE